MAMSGDRENRVVGRNPGRGSDGGDSLLLRKEKNLTS
jgi:hypothetical protein